MLVIILFHLKVNVFQGGFIGVDVFFVVSGYLITQIITSSLESGRFSFMDFYIRRSTRILPALVVTVLLTLLAATYLQQPEPLVHTAKQSISALLSLSNFFFWSEASYWAPSAEKYVLLHTWSLGVEEQFYLVYPLLLFACHRIGGMRAVAILLALTIVLGTVASEVVLRSDRTAAFFFTPLRFYEFAVGGLGAVLSARITRLLSSAWLAGALTLLGLIFIFYSVVMFNPVAYRLPGVATLLPVFGALLILLAGPSPSARVLLINPVMSWLGKTSYSLYLIHWPIIVFYRYYYGSSLSIMEQAALLIAILVAGELLCRSVERRFRLVGGENTTATGISSRAVLLGILASTISLLIVCALLVSNKGWPSRMPAEAQALMDIKPRQDMLARKSFYKEQCVPQGEIFCGERQADKKNILLLGDSRVLDLYISLKMAYPDAAIRSSYAMGCVPVFSPGISMSRFTPDCPDFNLSRLQSAIDAPSDDIIFLAQDTTVWRSEAILETARRLRESGKEVYVYGQFKIVEDRTPIELAIDSYRFKARNNQLENFFVENPYGLDGEFADRVRATGAVYISNKDFFYDGEYHLTDRETGKLLTYDGKHLNQFGARKFGQYLQQHYPLL